MKTQTVIFTIALMCILRLSFPQKAPSFALHINQKAVLAIAYEKNDSLLPYKIEAFNILPAHVPAEVYDTLALGSGMRYITIDVMAPVRSSLYIGTWRWSIYLVPKDTIQLLIRPGASLTDRVTFTGRYATIHHYYEAQNTQFNHSDLIQSRAIAANNAPSLRAYQMVMDSIARIEQQFFLVYCQTHALPNWFVADEQLNMLYTDAALRVNTIFYRQFMNKGAKEPIPATYYDFLKKVSFNNPKALHLTSYWQFISDFLYNKSNPKIGVVQSSTAMIQDFQVARNYLDKYCWDFYRTIQLSKWVGYDMDRVIIYLNKYGASFTVPGLVNFLRQSIKEHEYKLPVGSVAPNFVLADELDSLRSLKEFAGNVVYLSFWFPGCKLVWLKFLTKMHWLNSLKISQ